MSIPFFIFYCRRAYRYRRNGILAGDKTFSAAALCELFAPPNEAVSLCERREAKSAAGESAIGRFPPPPSVKILLPETKPYAFAGGGEQRRWPASRR